MDYEHPLAGQVAIVTGAGGGIGAAIAEALAGAGAAVVINYHSDDAPARAMVEQIERGGGRADAVRADVSEPGDVARMVDGAVQKYGALDIMVANAGVQKDAAFVDMTLDDWNAVLRTDLTGQFLCAQAAARAFRKQGVRDVSRAAGKIICIGSVHEVIPWAGHANYAASKGGVAMLMKTMAQELAADRIRVNAIAPGAIKTAINRSVWDDPEKNAALLKLIPYGRIGDARDVGLAAIWLASDLSDYVTGLSLTIDGGMSLYPSFLGNG